MIQRVPYLVLGGCGPCHSHTSMTRRISHFLVACCCLLLLQHCGVQEMIAHELFSSPSSCSAVPTSTDSVPRGRLAILPLKKATRTCSWLKAALFLASTLVLARTAEGRNGELPSVRGGHGGDSAPRREGGEALLADERCRRDEEQPGALRGPGDAHCLGDEAGRRRRREVHPDATAEVQGRAVARPGLPADHLPSQKLRRLSCKESTRSSGKTRLNRAEDSNEKRNTGNLCRALRNSRKIQKINLKWQGRTETGKRTAHQRRRLEVGTGGLHCRASQKQRVD